MSNPPDLEASQAAVANPVAAWWYRRPRWQQVLVVLVGTLLVAQALSPDSPREEMAVAAVETSVAQATGAPSPTRTTPGVTSVTAPATSAPPDSTAPIPETTSPTSTVSPDTTIGASTTTAPPTSDLGRAASVTAVIDGDTVTVDLAGSTESLRLIGINSPENGECYSEQASARLVELVAGQEVRLVGDRSNRDQYGRLLRYVYLGDLFVNETLVREGYAIARRYEPDTAMASLLETAQAAAQDEEAGLWAPEACGATAGTTIRIGQIHYDAAGDDNTNLNDEWVEFVNGGSESVELTGWVVKDESASHRYPLPAGFVLGPGTTVRLHTGCGEDTASLLYWCNQGSAVWNNSGGDTVFLLDPNGNIAVSERYES
jgi:micrococcal nuclease